MPDGRSKTRSALKRLGWLPLAIIPVLALWSLVSKPFAPEWLGLPDGVLAAFLVLGIETRPATRVTMIVVTIGLLAVGSGLNPKVTSLLVPAMINLILALMFGLSLGQGREALITRVARLARGPRPMTLDHLRYTRNLTRTWGFLFIALALLSLILALFATPGFTLFFANAINPMIAGLFLVIESIFRRHIFPGEPPTPLRRVMEVLSKEGWRETAR